MRGAGACRGDPDWPPGGWTSKMLMGRRSSTSDRPRMRTMANCPGRTPGACRGASKLKRKWPPVRDRFSMTGTVSSNICTMVAQVSGVRCQVSDSSGDRPIRNSKFDAAFAVHEFRVSALPDTWHLIPGTFLTGVSQSIAGCAAMIGGETYGENCKNENRRWRPAAPISGGTPGFSPASTIHPGGRRCAARG